MKHYDVIVIGGGPGGERAAIQAARAGKQVALVERANVVGGNRINWGTIPSKSLRETALFVYGLTHRNLDAIPHQIPGEISIADFMHRERVVVQRELELINKALDRHAVEVFHGHARFADPHTVSVSSLEDASSLKLAGDVIVVASGAHPVYPPGVPVDPEVIFDNASILRLPHMPRSMIVLGGGVVGVEYASIFAALGLEVTLIDIRDRLLPFLDHEIGDLLDKELRRLGVAILQNERQQTVERLPGQPPRVRLTTATGAVRDADVLLHCVGRLGNTGDLGLETIGLATDARGLLHVNENYQTALPHIYAVGDVIGEPALASTSMEQGRQAMRHAFNIPGPKGHTEQTPFAIYAIPEVSYIGRTEESLRGAGADYVAGRGRYALNPRGQIIGDTTGLLKLLFDVATMELIGVHVIGHAASELVHIGQAFLRERADANCIAETLYNYPTLSDLYRHAALEALLARAKRTDAPGAPDTGAPT